MKDELIPYLCLISSFLLHGILLTFHVNYIPLQQEPIELSTNDDLYDVEIIEKNSLTETTLVDKTPTPGEMVILFKKDENKNCKKWIGGIGVMVWRDFQSGDLEIIKIENSYPASRSSLRVGDYITRDSQITGEPNTETTLTVHRGSNQFTVKIMREKICYE